MAAFNQVQELPQQHLWSSLFLAGENKNRNVTDSFDFFPDILYKMCINYNFHKKFYFI